MSAHHRPSRLSSYSKVAVGSLAAAPAAGSAEAAIVFFDVNPDQTIGIGQSVSFGSINLSNGTYALGGTAAPTFTLSGVGASLFSFSSSGSPIVQVATVPGYYTDAVNFSLNDPIPGGPYFSNYILIGANQDYGGDWVPGASGYLGLRIDQGSGNFNYGWAQFAFGPNSGDPATITGFAFETTANASINAGAVPEPSTYALLVLAGLFGAAVWYHRRQKVGAPTELLQLAAGARGVEKFRADKSA